MDAARQPPRGTDWQGVIFGVSVGALAAFQFFKLPPVLTLLTDAYGYSRVYSGALMSVYSVAGLLLAWTVGRTCSRHGPRGLLLAAFICSMVGNGLGLWAPHYAPAMLSSRLLEGIGFTIFSVVGGVIATTSASPTHRLLATALWATWIPLGQIIETLVAIPVVAADQWRPLWWGALLLTAAAAAWGHLLTCSGRAAFRKPSTTAANKPQEADRTETENAETRRALLLVMALFAFWSMQFISFMTWLPIYLIEVLGLNSTHAVATYLVPPVLIVIFNLLAGVVLRSGGKLSLLLGTSLACQAAVWYLVPWTNGLAAGMLSLTVYGVTSGIIPTCLFALPGALPGSGISASKGFAALMTGRNLGVLVGPILLGQVIAFQGGWGVATPLFGTICVAALAINWAVSRHLAPQAASS